MYIAIDQYGDKVFIDKYPRKELLEKRGIKHIAKMYCDTKDGQTKHIGYILQGSWYRVYGLEGVKFESFV
jgi:hypothetical protein